jgi:hypothetical protein
MKALKKLYASSDLFPPNDPRATASASDIISAIRTSTALPSALKALGKLDAEVGRRFEFLLDAFTFSRQDIADSSGYCEDDLLHACLGDYCTNMNRTRASQTIRFLRSTIVQTSLLAEPAPADDAECRAFTTRVGAFDEGPHAPRQSWFAAESTVRAIVLPFHDASMLHWSLLVFYRNERRPATWIAKHYDSLKDCHAPAVQRFVGRFCTRLAAAEPAFELVSPYDAITLYGGDADARATYRNAALRTQAPVEFYETPLQHSDWECGYKTIMMALTVARGNGNVTAVDEYMRGNTHTSDTGCAKYLARCLEKIARFAHLLSVRTRLRAVTDFSDGVPEPPPAAEENEVVVVRRKIPVLDDDIECTNSECTNSQPPEKRIRS